MGTSSAPRPFTVHVPDGILQDLRERLARVRWPDEVPADLAYLRGLCEHWRAGYDWRAHEARLNAFRQLTAPVTSVTARTARSRAGRDVAVGT